MCIKSGILSYCMTHTHTHLGGETRDMFVYGPLTNCVDETVVLDTGRMAVSGNWQWTTLWHDDWNVLVEVGGVLLLRTN